MTEVLLRPSPRSDVEPVPNRRPPPPRNVEFAVYPPGYGPSSNARRAANAEAARQRRSDIHFERRGNRMTRGVIVSYGETPIEDMEVEDIDDQYHDEL